MERTQSKIHVKDIREIPPNGSITVRLPSYLACISARNTLTYVRKAYPRNDGCIYYSSVVDTTITIGATTGTKPKRKYLCNHRK